MSDNNKTAKAESTQNKNSENSNNNSSSTSSSRGNIDNSASSSTSSNPTTSAGIPIASLDRDSLIKELEATGFYPDSHDYDPKLTIKGSDSLLTLTRTVNRKDEERSEFEYFHASLIAYQDYVKALSEVPHNYPRIKALYTKVQSYPPRYTQFILNKAKRDNPGFYSHFINENLAPEVIEARSKFEERKSNLAIAKELLEELIFEFSKVNTQQLYPAKADLEARLSKRFTEYNRLTNGYLEKLLLPVSKKYSEVFLRIERNAELASSSSAQSSNQSGNSSANDSDNTPPKASKKSNSSKRNVRPFEGDSALLSD